MTVRVDDPSGRRWEVRRSVVRGPDSRGWRWRWRGPEQLGALSDLLALGELADVPVLGVVVMAVLIPALVVLVLILVPFLTIALLEALVLAVLATAGVLAATAFGRPILVRAEPAARPEGDDDPMPQRVWAVRGWRASARVRDTVVEALRAGLDPSGPAGAEGTELHPGSPPV